MAVYIVVAKILRGIEKTVQCTMAGFRIFGQQRSQPVIVDAFLFGESDDAPVRVMRVGDSQLLETLRPALRVRITLDVEINGYDPEFRVMGCAFITHQLQSGFGNLPGVFEMGIAGRKEGG